MLSVKEKLEEVASNEESWQVNDAVSEEKRQYDHVRIVVANDTEKEDEDEVVRRRRAVDFVPQLFDGAHLELEDEMGDKEQYFIAFKGDSCVNKKVFQCELEIGQSNGECPLGWLHFENRCYKYYELNKEWREARKICKSAGADLAVLDSFQEQVRTHYFGSQIDFRFWGVVTSSMNGFRHN